MAVTAETRPQSSAPLRHAMTIKAETALEPLLPLASPSIPQVPLQKNCGRAACNSAAMTP